MLTREIWTCYRLRTQPTLPSGIQSLLRLWLVKPKMPRGGSNTSSRRRRSRRPAVRTSRQVKSAREAPSQARAPTGGASLSGHDHQRAVAGPRVGLEHLSPAPAGAHRAARASGGRWTRRRMPKSQKITRTHVDHTVLGCSLARSRTGSVMSRTYPNGLACGDGATRRKVRNEQLV